MGEQKENHKVSILKIDKKDLTKPNPEIIKQVWDAWKGIDNDIIMSIPQWEDSHYEMVEENIRNKNGIDFTNFRIGDEIIDSAVDEFKKDNSENNLIRVVVLLDAIYHTRLDDSFKTASKIKEKGILDGGLTEATDESITGIVNTITRINLPQNDGEKKTGNYIYSFATKLCNRFRPDLFPIYDRFVVGLLSVYMKVPRTPMGKYSEFCKIYNDFIRKTEWCPKRPDDEKKYKIIDTFLWTYGRVLANKECGVQFDPVSYIEP